MFRETNPVTVLLVIALAGAGFYGFHVAPLYLDNLEVKEAAAEAFNTWIVEGEERARFKLMLRLNGKGTGYHHEIDDDGVEQVKPGLGIPDEQVTFDFDDGKRVLTVSIAYTRLVQFKPLEKRKTYSFSVMKSGTIQR